MFLRAPSLGKQPHSSTKFHLTNLFSGFVVSESEQQIHSCSDSSILPSDRHPYNFPNNAIALPNKLLKLKRSKLNVIAFPNKPLKTKRDRTPRTNHSKPIDQNYTRSHSQTNNSKRNAIALPNQPFKLKRDCTL
jgi:hypothetical protein